MVTMVNSSLDIRSTVPESCLRAQNKSWLHRVRGVARGERQAEAIAPFTIDVHVPGRCWAEVLESDPELRYSTHRLRVRLLRNVPNANHIVCAF